MSHPRHWTTRYGAGVLNVFNSYEQLAGGKQSYIVSTSVITNSPHPPTGATGTVGVLNGWDFNTNASSATADAVKHYYFNVTNGREHGPVHRHRHAGLEPAQRQDQHQQPRSVFV